MAEAGTLKAQLDAWQPSFRDAVRGDAEATARFRNERAAPRSRAGEVIRAVRLLWAADAFFAQVCYRAKVCCRVRGIPVLPRLLDGLAVVTSQVRIGDHVVIAPGLYLPHGNVVIDGVVGIGPGAVLRPYVTVGLVDGNIVGPRLDARVRVGTGAKLIGPIQVGAGAQIGANAVVLRDVPARSTAVGVPARIVAR